MANFSKRKAMEVWADLYENLSVSEADYDKLSGLFGKVVDSFLHLAEVTGGLENSNDQEEYRKASQQAVNAALSIKKAVEETGGITWGKFIKQSITVIEEATDVNININRFLT